MKNTLTIQDFFKRFPDDESCLSHLFKVRFGEEVKCPKCKKVGGFHKLKKLPAYACQWCGHHIHPMVDTPFQASQTPLQKWFYAIYLFTTSRHGVPAKELQRQLGVTYKCAWRMAHEIRKYMGRVDGDDSLSGHVEVDETWLGGKEKRSKPGFSRKNTKKTIILGMVERNGKLMTKILPNLKGDNIIPMVEKNIDKGSKLTTDESHVYKNLKGYDHDTVNHGIYQYVKGIHHTNSIEGFWSQIKRSIRGTHIHVSKKHLQKYLVEFEFRYNMRATPSLMFDCLLASF